MFKKALPFLAGLIAGLTIALPFGRHDSVLTSYLEPTGAIGHGNSTFQKAVAGDCLNWPDNAPDQATIVDCKDDHRFEVADRIEAFAAVAYVTKNLVPEPDPDARVNGDVIWPSAVREDVLAILQRLDLQGHGQRARQETHDAGPHHVGDGPTPVCVIGVFGQIDCAAAVFAAGLSHTQDTVANAVSFGERFEYRHLNNLSGDDAMLALIAPAHEAGVGWESSALESVLSETQGYPYFIQEFGDKMWEAAGYPGPGGALAMQHYAAARAEFEEARKTLFRSRWAQATAAEQKRAQGQRQHEADLDGDEDRRHEEAQQGQRARPHRTRGGRDR